MPSLSLPVASKVSDPLPGENQVGRYGFWFAVAVTIALFFAGIYPPRFNPDSWAYLELSNSIFSDFYRVNTVRQFEYSTSYGVSFPPLWPILIALGRKVFDVGIYTGYWLNAIICIGLLIALKRISVAMLLPSWLGIAVYLAILGFPPFLVEIIAARSIPLSLLLMVAAGAIGIRGRLPWTAVAGVAVLMGLGSLTRFDGLPVAAVFGGFLTFRVWFDERNVPRVLLTGFVYFITIALVLSPWMYYCISHFGKPFISDNSRQLLVGGAGHVLDFYVNPPPNELINDPVTWIKGLLSQKIPAWRQELVQTITWSALPLLLATSAVTVRSRFHASIPLRWFAILVGLVVPTMLLPAAVVGYGDARYFTGALLLLYVLLLGVLVAYIPDAWTESRIKALLVVSAVPVCGISLAYGVRTTLAALDSSIHFAPLSATPEMSTVAAIMHSGPGEKPKRILIGDPTYAASFGALTNVPTTLMPRFPENELDGFVGMYGITHVYKVEIANEVFRDSNLELTPLNVTGLYRIGSKSHRLLNGVEQQTSTVR